MKIFEKKFRIGGKEIFQKKNSVNLFLKDTKDASLKVTSKSKMGQLSYIGKNLTRQTICKLFIKNDIQKKLFRSKLEFLLI